MKIRFLGLLAEKLPSGAVRYRVRVEGQKAKRIPLSVPPDHPQFIEIYRAARTGVQISPRLPQKSAQSGGLSAGWPRSTSPRWSER